MKKLYKLLIGTVLAASFLAGCGSTAVSSSASQSLETSSNSAVAGDAGSVSAGSSSEEQTTDANNSTSSGNDKVLVLYYSASGTTKKIADMIAKDTGAAEYEVQPAKPYTSDDLDYTNNHSRVNKEGADPSLQNVEFKSTDVPDWSSYDTVFVGYPIWREDASWVMKSFVTHLDFTGKTVIPFATSSSSDIGKSGENLAALAENKGSWLDGKRFSGGASNSEVQDWINSLQLK